MGTYYRSMLPHAKSVTIINFSESKFTICKSGNIVGNPPLCEKYKTLPISAVDAFFNTNYTNVPNTTFFPVMQIVRVLN